MTEARTGAAGTGTPALGGAAAALLNLLLPGAGLIVIGFEGAGLLLGLTFGLVGGLAIASNWIIPAEFHRAARVLALAAAAFVYLGTQLRMAQALRIRQRDIGNERRRSVLAECRAAAATGDHERALRLLSELTAEDPAAVLPWVRRAQVLAAAGRVDEARQAWAEARRLDRHGVYRNEARRGLSETGE